MPNHNSAVEREETPHTTNPDQNDTLKVNRCMAVAVRRRAESVIRDRSIDAQSRTVIRYALETNDPWLGELVRRVDAGENIIDTVDFSEESLTSESNPDEQKIEALTELICQAGDDPAAKSVALLVLMAAIEGSDHPKALANIAKHLAFTRCGELNVCGMVESQTAVLEWELFSGNTLVA